MIMFRVLLAMVFWLTANPATTDAAGTPFASPTSSTHLSSERGGWSLTVPAGWTVSTGSSGWKLAHRVSVIDVFETDAYHGSQMDCVVGEMAKVKSDPATASTTVWRDDPTVRASEMEQGHSSMTYTVDLKNGEDDVVRIDCYTIVRGEIDLVIVHRAARATYGEERLKGDAVRAALTWPRP